MILGIRPAALDNTSTVHSSSFQYTQKNIFQYIPIIFRCTELSSCARPLYSAPQYFTAAPVIRERARFEQVPYRDQIAMVGKPSRRDMEHLRHGKDKARPGVEFGSICEVGLAVAQQLRRLLEPGSGSQSTRSPLANRKP